MPHPSSKYTNLFLLFGGRSFCASRTEPLLRLYSQQDANGTQTISKVIPFLAEPRHHDATFYSGDDVLCQNFRLDLHLEFSGVLSLT